jgi:hypothetical protein
VVGVSRLKLCVEVLSISYDWSKFILGYSAFEKLLCNPCSGLAFLLFLTIESC